LLAALFAVVPDRRIPMRNVWLGSSVSALLFVLGQYILGWYLAKVAASSVYGSFGGIVVFMLWTFYNAQIILFGAEFARVSSLPRD